MASIGISAPRGLAALALLAACAGAFMPRPARADGPALAPPAALTPQEKRQLDALRPPAAADAAVPAAPRAEGLTAGLRPSGAYFGLSFGIGGDRIEAGYAAMRRGDIESTLNILDQGERDAGAWSDMPAFRMAGLRADVLVRASRAHDADVALARAGALERKIWSKDWITLARRGDALARRGEHAQAEGDLGRVVLALRDWQLPTQFDEMPDVRDLMFRTEAKIRAYLGLASLYIRSGDYARATSWAAAAEAHFASLFELASGQYGGMVPMVPDFYIGRGENLAYLGAGLLAMRRDAAPAEPYFAAARGFFAAIGYAFGEAVAAAVRVQALHDAGLTEAFHAAAPDAVAAAARAGLGEIVWRLEALRGRLLLDGGRHDEAEAALRRAQQAVELVSGGLASDRARLAFGVGKEDITRLLARIGAENGHHDLLFEDLERGRARAFVDLLAGRQLARGRQDALVGEIRELDRRIRYQRLANAFPAGSGEAGREREARLVERRTHAADALRARDPELAAALSVARRATLSGIRAKLSADDVLAYVLPALAEAPQGLLLIAADATRLVPLPATSGEISRLVADFREAVGQGDAARQKTLAGTLGERLDLRRWAPRGTLYVVPGGPFHFMPWGALDIETPVVTLPTGDWLLRAAQVLPGDRAASVLGDPAFGGKLPQLPGARREAREVAALYGVAPLLDEAASEAALRAQVGDGVRVLHLATHGRFDADVPLDSSLALGGPDGVRYLTAARLFEAPLPARLVVLSACETGVGRALAGEDFLGLARSLYLGGAMTVVHSLWPIEDLGTLEFMKAFHAAAREGHFGRAWLAARNRLRKLGYPPAMYGAFVLGGAAEG